MTPKRRKILIILVVLVVLSQLIPVGRSNPPVTAELVAPQELQSVLRQSCYDCHSNETVWPWYSRVAPFSWLLAIDVAEGREHLNFSTWENLGPERQAKLKKETREVVDEGEMPPWYYVIAHQDARLSEQDKTLIRNWAGPGGRD